MLNTWVWGAETSICSRLKALWFSKASHPLSPNSNRRIISLKGKKKKPVLTKKEKFVSACLYSWSNDYLLIRSQRTSLHLREWFQNVGYAATTYSYLDTFWNPASGACSSLFSFLSRLYSCNLTLYRISLLYRVRLLCETSDETRKLQSKLSNTAASSLSPSSLSWHPKQTFNFQRGWVILSYISFAVPVLSNPSMIVLHTF